LTICSEQSFPVYPVGPRTTMSNSLLSCIVYAVRCSWRIRSFVDNDQETKRLRLLWYTWVYMRVQLESTSSRAHSLDNGQCSKSMSYEEIRTRR
jgi:hypothetical protein